ncbi:hypothetical protein B6A10_02400 [Flavobacterium sp. L1I52]|uniref:Uncharacterized protein n=1 Tax=Flavobacterium pokkalii TaxID=1940408 RepID=A0ABR7UMB5_9FLAO|nr:hypothetical protein [Flavobacterium pokkalii]
MKLNYKIILFRINSLKFEVLLLQILNYFLFMRVPYGRAIHFNLLFLKKKIKGFSFLSLTRNTDKSKTGKLPQ